MKTAAIIKPLVTEIHLFDSFAAGTSHLTDKSVLEEIAVGDKLSLRRENNKFDDNAIFARLMDAGKLLSATVTDIEKKGYFTQISIGIYLVDF